MLQVKRMKKKLRKGASDTVGKEFLESSRQAY